MRRGTVTLERIAAWVVVGVVVAAAIHGTVAFRGLVADGAYYLWGILQNQGLFLFDGARAIAQFVTQLPVVVAISWGVDDRDALILLLGAGLVALPMLIWAAALALLVGHRLFWPMVAAFAVVHLNSGYVAVGEYTLLYALVALATALLVRDRFGWGSAAALVVVGVLSLRTYEAAFYLGPLLAVVAVLRWRRARREPAASPAHWALLVAAALLAVAGVLGLLAFVFPRDAANRQGAADLLAPISDNPALVISVVIAVAFVVSRLLAGWARAFAGVLLALCALILLLPDLWAVPWMHYQARTITGLTLLVLVVLALVDEWRARAVRESGRSPAWVVAFVLLVVQVIPFTVHTQGYADWLASFRHVLDTQNQPVLFEVTGLSSTYVWPWTNPFLSLELRAPGSETLILNPGQTEVQPGMPPELPARFLR